MKRRAFLCGLTLGTLAAPLAVEAQGKVPLVGFLDPHSPSIAAPYHDAFRQGLRDRGYVDGQNIRIEYRWADGKDERLPDLAAELVRLQVNVMVTGGPQATRAATEATSSIPIVMVAVGADPVKMRLVASLARPGGNITGSTLLSPELSAKRLQLLKEAVPKLRPRGCPLEFGQSSQAPRLGGNPSGSPCIGRDCSIGGGTTLRAV